MIFTQVTLEVQETVKKDNGAEANISVPYPLPALKQRITQDRLDAFSMQGLSKSYRYELENIGELENLIFEYFYDENNTKYKTTVWERNPKNNKMILEGVVANGL